MRSSVGWFKIWRLPEDHWMMSDPSALFLWWTLISMATYKPTKIKSGLETKELDVGTVVTSRGELALKTGLGEQNIRSRLTLFENDSMINQQKTNRGTIITICNWKKYQDTEEDENQPITNEKPANNQPITNEKPLIKNLRIKEEKKEYNPPLPPAGEDHPLVLIWNQNTDGIPKVAKMTKARKVQADARLRESPDLDQWKACAVALNSWQFGRGVNDRGWKANFDYFLRPGTLVKFLEGGYEEKPVKPEKREIRRNRDGSVDTRTAITYGRTESDKAPWEN